MPSPTKKELPDTKPFFILFFYPGVMPKHKKPTGSCYAYSRVVKRWCARAT